MGTDNLFHVAARMPAARIGIPCRENGYREDAIHDSSRGLSRKATSRRMSSGRI